MAETCEECSAPGGEVVNKRDGVVVWRRVLCGRCFRSFIGQLQASGVTILPKGEA